MKRKQMILNPQQMYYSGAPCVLPSGSACRCRVVMHIVRDLGFIPFRSSRNNVSIRLCLKEDSLVSKINSNYLSWDISCLFSVFPSSPNSYHTSTAALWSLCSCAPTLLHYFSLLELTRLFHATLNAFMLLLLFGKLF